jgi:hypothetical protein
MVTHAVYLPGGGFGTSSASLSATSPDFAAQVESLTYLTPGSSTLHFINANAAVSGFSAKQRCSILGYVL